MIEIVGMSNYLIDFLKKIDILISEINKLDSKIRLYHKNSKKFGIKFDCNFSISSEYFVKLRDLIQEKLEQGSPYDKKIVQLKRDFFKEFNYIITGISKEILRIEVVQEKAMNDLVYNAIYNAEMDSEIRIRDSFNVSSSIFDNFLGIAKYRNLSYENHNLKIEKMKKNYKVDICETKNIFELVNLIENSNAKNGELLCLQDDIIKYFMIDRNTIKRTTDRNWKQVTLVPRGIFNIRNHYKILNKNLRLENTKLRNELNQKSEELTIKKDSVLLKLEKINVKLSKIIKNNLSSEFKI